MRNASLNEFPAGIKISRRNIYNLRYVDTTIMAESEGELKSLLMRVKEENEKPGLKFNIKKKKAKITASSPIPSSQIEGEKVEPVTDFLFLGSKITADGDYSQEIRRQLLLGRKALTNLVQFRSVQPLSHVRLFVTPWTAARQGSLSITNSRSLLKLMSIKSVMTSNHLILCRPLLLPPSIFPSIRVFSKESVLCIKWPKYWRFSFSISPSNEYSGLI